MAALEEIESAIMRAMSDYDIEGACFNYDRKLYKSFLASIAASAALAIRLYGNIPFDGLEKLHESKLVIVDPNSVLTMHDHTLRINVMGGVAGGRG